MTLLSFLFPRLTAALGRLRNAAANQEPNQTMPPIDTAEALRIITTAGNAITNLRTTAKDAVDALQVIGAEKAELAAKVQAFEDADAAVDAALIGLRETLVGNEEPAQQPTPEPTQEPTQEEATPEEPTPAE